MKKEEWVYEYEQCSEDRRHYTNLSWQIPSTIIIVNGVLLSFAIDSLRPPISGIVILFGAILSLILTLNFIKFAHRSKERLRRLKELDKLHEFKRFTYKEPWWVSWRLAPPMFLLLLAFTIFLSIIGVLNLCPPFDC